MARILVIDDDTQFRTTLEKILKAANYEVVLAADGNEGIQKQNAEPMDLIIIDLFMPEREGLETIQQLRKDFPELPIIAISGNDMSGPMLTIASKLGADKILQKPFNAGIILKAIQEVV
jgi:DNA-binding response OmpR family regulator